MIMKFNTKNKLLFLIISLSIVLLSFSLRLKNKQTEGVEQQDITMSIFNNATQFVSSNDINVKLVQNIQKVNDTNKYVGYWQTTIKGSHRNFTPFDFLEQIPNFGKLIDKSSVNIDFRYILGCNFESKEESNSIKTSFQMMSKESTSQHVYNIEFILPSAGNNLEEVKKYFDGIAKICLSTQETLDILKSELTYIVKENLSLKRKKAKKIISGKKSKIENNSTFDTNSTDISPPAIIAMPGNPHLNATHLFIDDITDPDVKNKIKKYSKKIEKHEEKIKKSLNYKPALINRANELMDRVDKDNRVLSVIGPKKEEYDLHSVSANLTITHANENITQITELNINLYSSLSGLQNTKVQQDGKVKNLTDSYNNVKSELNKNIDSQKNIKKAISEVEAKANVDTEILTNVENKKTDVLRKINDLTAEIKKDGDDLDSNQKNLNLFQTNFNNLEEEGKKNEKQIEEVKLKIKELMKKENDIKRQIDPKQMSSLETQKEGTITQLSDLEKILKKKKDSVMAVIDPQFGEVLEKAYAEITHKDNLDPESYLKIMKTIPAFVWTVPK